MNNHCYEIFEVVGSSNKSIEEAINCALGELHDKHGKLRWFEVLETRGHIENGKVSYYQVSLKVGTSPHSKNP